jgi:hypothetical protein
VVTTLQLGDEPMDAGGRHLFSTISTRSLVEQPTERNPMKIVVIGGTGLIGSKVVTKLGEHGDEAVAAAPNTGVNTLTGEGLADAWRGRRS